MLTNWTIAQKAGYSVVIERRENGTIERLLFFAPDGSSIGSQQNGYSSPHDYDYLINYSLDGGALSELPDYLNDMNVAWSLPLPEGYGWKIIGSLPGVAGQVTICNYQTMQTYTALFHKDVARAMCEAWWGMVGWR